MIYPKGKQGNRKQRGKGGGQDFRFSPPVDTFGEEQGPTTIVQGPTTSPLGLHIIAMYVTSSTISNDGTSVWRKAAYKGCSYMHRYIYVSARACVCVYVRMYVLLPQQPIYMYEY